MNFTEYINHNIQLTLAVWAVYSFIFAEVIAIGFLLNMYFKQRGLEHDLLSQKYSVQSQETIIDNLNIEVRRKESLLASVQARNKELKLQLENLTIPKTMSTIGLSSKVVEEPVEPKKAKPRAPRKRPDAK